MKFLAFAISLVLICCGSVPHTTPLPPVPTTLYVDSLPKQMTREAYMSFDIYPLYREWWAQIEGCMKLHRPIEEIAFFLVRTPTFSFKFDDGVVTPPLNGAYNDNTNQIFLGLGWEMYPYAVRHEMLHAIMHGNHGEHPDSLFGEKAPCASLVRRPDQ